MKKLLVGGALLAAALSTAHAQAVFRPVVGMGLTGGGDNLATVTYRDGSTQDIRGGGLVALYGGGEVKFGEKFTLQTTVGYHVDDTRAATNGSVRFTRYPLDLVGLFHLNDNVRLGVGVQHVSSPKLVGSGVVSDVQARFKSTTGVIATGEYLFSNKLGLALRVVSEKFEPEGGGEKVSGDHIGLMLNYYFF